MSTTSSVSGANRNRSADADVLLRIYLNDHRAGAAGGLALAKRSQRSNEGSPLGAVLRTLVGQLEGDADALERVMHELELAENQWKRALARAGEMVGRLKPNGRVASYSPSSRVVELELLMAGIDAKRSLWRTLRATRSDQITAVDLEELIHRAGEQRELLRPYHLVAARAAFSGSD